MSLEIDTIKHEMKSSFAVVDEFESSAKHFHSQSTN